MGELLGVTSRLVTAAELDDEELARCVALLTEAFQVWPSQETRVSAGEYLRWKLEMPGPLASQMHLLEMGEELVALGVYQARGYRLFGKRYGVVDGEDAAVHPAHQGEGLYGRRRVLKAELVGPPFA